MRRSSGRLRHAGRLHAVSPGDLESVGLRVLSGRPLHWRQRLAGVVVVASDIDADVGVAGVWLARRAGSPDAVDEVCLFERVNGRWRYLGSGGRTGSELLRAGRPSASRAGPASMITSMSGCASRSLADREAQGGQQDFLRVGWVACAMFRVAAEVQHLQAGARQISVPQHGYVIVAWKAGPGSDVPPRPPIVAVGEDRSRLSELGPNDHLDSYSWAGLEAAIEGD
jgi:hypothetical protein